MGDRVMVCHFLDEDPRKVWAPFAGLRKSIDESGKATAPGVPHVGDPLLGEGEAADVGQELQSDGHHLELVGVDVDDRVVDAERISAS